MENGEEYDIVLFDLPGTVNNQGVAKTVSLMDYIFCPVAADKLILESSLAFAMKVRDEIMTLPDSSIKEMHMVWNLVDARERTELYDRYEEVFEEQLLPTLKTRLPDTKRYRREGSKEASRPCSAQRFSLPTRHFSKGAASWNWSMRFSVSSSSENDLWRKDMTIASTPKVSWRISALRMTRPPPQNLPKAQRWKQGKEDSRKICVT